jgi:molecular chaperone DnaK
MVKEAEAARENDAKKREVVEIKNESDSMIYNTEKQLQEHASRIPDSVKNQVRGDISSLQEALNTNEATKIKDALERLKNSSMEIGKAIYSQANQESQQQNQEGQQQSTEGQEQPKEGEEKKN